MNGQEIIVGLIVAGSVAFIGLRIYKLLFAKKKAGCEKCDLPAK